MARFSYLLNLLLVIWVAYLCSLTLSAPLEFNEKSNLVKRDDDPIYTIWKNIPKPQMALGDSALHFKIDQSVDNAWGVTYLYGCVAVVISDPEYIIVSHMQQDTKKKTKCINDPAALNEWLNEKLLPALDQEDEPGEMTQIDLIFNNYDCSDAETKGRTKTGVQIIKEFLVQQWGANLVSIKTRPYYGSSGLGTPNPASPRGLAVARWLKPPDSSTRGTLQVYFNSDTPIRSQVVV